MKSTFVFLTLFALCSSLVIPSGVKQRIARRIAGKYGKPADSVDCLVCKSIVEDSEKWAGNEESGNEQGQIDECVKLVSEILPILAQLFCVDFVKNELDAVIKHLEDPANENQDAETACKALNLCS